MKRILLRALLLALALAALGGFALAEVHTTVDSGSCGANTTWELWKDASGLMTLEISGNGPIESASWGYPSPRIERLILNEGITEIPNWCFALNVRGVEVICPKSLRSIGAGAFRYVCPTRVTLNEGLLTIGEFAFDDENSCFGVVIPKSVTDIGFKAFTGGTIWAYEGTEGEQWCKDWGMAYQKMPNSPGARQKSLMALLDAIGDVDDVPARYRQPVIQALLRMDGLTTTQLNTLTSYVRQQKSLLKRYMADNDLSYAEITYLISNFMTRMNAIGVTASTEVKMINGFWGVELQVTASGETQTLSVYRSGATWTLSDLPRGETMDYTYQTTDEGVVVTGYKGLSNALNIPASINGTAVIGVNALDYSSFPDNITHINLPEGLRFIGPGTFYDLYNLTYLSLPSTLEIIDDGAFNLCTNLTSVTLPDNLRILGDAFRYTGVTSVTLPKALEHLGRVFDHINVDPGNPNFKMVDGALYNDLEHALIWYDPEWTGTYVNVRNNTEVIYRCGNQNTLYVTLPNSVRRIKSSAFQGCDSLNDVVLNEGLTSIEARAFYNCYNLTNVSIPSTVTYIGDKAFYGTPVDEITIPAGLDFDATIMRHFLSEFGMLSHINVSPNHPRYSSKGGVLFSKDGLTLIYYPRNRFYETSYTVPNGTMVIGESAFEGATLLEDIVLPAGLDAIIWNAFKNTNISSLDIPEGTRRVSSQDYMPNLTELRIPGSVLDLGVTWICPSTPTVYGISGTPAEKLAQQRGWPFVSAGSGIYDIRFAGVSSISLYAGEFGQWLEVTVNNGAYSGWSGALVWEAEDPLVAQITEINGRRIRFCGGKAGTTTITASAPDNPGISASVTVTVKPLTQAPNVAILPSGLKTIESSAFAHTAYQYVYIPDGVKSIGSRAFIGCSNLKVVRIPDSMTHIALDAFAGCDGVTFYCSRNYAVIDDIYDIQQDMESYLVFWDYVKPLFNVDAV